MTNLASSGAVNCDSSWKAQPVTTSGGTTIFDVTTTITIGYLDPPITKGPFFVRGYKSPSSFDNCAMVTPFYEVIINPPIAECRSLLFWDSGATDPCTASKFKDDT